jgi:hypothetical protein
MQGMKRWLAVAFLVMVAASLSASVIGQWNGSARSWNADEFTTIHDLMVAQGNTVTADEAITAANLAAAQVFVIGEATAAPSQAELNDLLNWVSAGGRLIVLGDSGGSGQAGNNAIFAGVGSSMVEGGDAALSAFAGGNFATEGPPYNIVGQFLDISPGTAITGGFMLAGTYVEFQQIGAGYVYGFADRSDHNVFNPSDANSNGQLFLNIVGGQQIVTPEPSTLIMIGTGLAGFAGILRRKLIV